MSASAGCRPALDLPITGAELADEIEEMLRHRPDVSRTNFGFLINGGGSAIDKLRRIRHPKPKTVAKVRAMIADPPSESLLKVKPPKAERKPKRVSDPWLSRDRRAAACRRTVHARAEKRIKQGLLAGKAPNSVVRQAQIEIEAHLRELQRLSDPIEQAMTILRRKSVVVYRASVLGGAVDMFVISKRSGRETIDERQLMTLAGSAA